MKRGGNQHFLSIDAARAEGRYALEAADWLPPDRLFLPRLGLNPARRGASEGAREYEGDGRGVLFDHLKQVLTVGADTVPYATIAADLGMTEQAVQVAAHRLRRRYGAVMRQEIAATVLQPDDVEDEIRALFQALGP